MSNEILVLLALFQIKHLVADYYLQFPYMYENKGKETGWRKPLTDHAGVHAGLTMLILAMFSAYNGGYPNQIILILLLGAFDFSTHFLTDRWKAIKKDGPETSEFWYSLGIDQMVHHLVGIIIIWGFTQ